MGEGDAERIERLERENARLNEQLKLLSMTEKRLYKTQRQVESQLAQIHALNHFALRAFQIRSERGIFREAIELIGTMFPVEASLGVCWPMDVGPPLMLARGPDEDEISEIAFAVGDLAALGSPNSSVVRDPKAPGRLGPIWAWFDRLPGGRVPTSQYFQQTHVVLPLGRTSETTISAFIAFRSTSVSYHDRPLEESDRPFLDLVCRHLSGAMEMSGLQHDLERRVEDRTDQLSLANAELEMSLERLRNIQRQLVEASRLAGMADVATSVLHNVGNVLNSVNVSTGLAAEIVRRSRWNRVGQITDMMREHEHDLSRFLVEDDKGKQVVRYLDQLSKAGMSERSHLESEIKSIQDNINHIKAIVSLQQSYAKVGGLKETLHPSEVLEEALRLVSADASRVTVERDFDSAVPSMMIDRHKLLQIIINLVRNACQALEELVQPSKRITVRLRRADDHSVAIEIEDNGPGISEENLSKMFSPGFTTKKTGHGFGLHGSACNAMEMGGTLSVHSEGRGLGATFKLVLPMRKPSD